MEPLRLARDAYERRDWAVARDHFIEATRGSPLTVPDVEALADAAWWLGLTDEALSGYEQAYRMYLAEEGVPAAARLAMAIGFLRFLRGDGAVGSGWIGRARRLLGGVPECVEHGYLLSLDVDEAVAMGDFDRAVAGARRVQDMAVRFADQTLHSAGLVSEGIALIKQGRADDGLAVLDEAMLPVRAGEVSPEWAGNFYCQVMGICHELADLRRARQWTDATERWCDQFDSAVMFAGICRVHRVQLLQLEGAWDRAEREAAQVCAQLADMNAGVVAEGHYQLGEIRRLRNDHAAAEREYRRAHELGRDPQPGLALLRLSQGRVAAASASIRSALAAQTTDRPARARLLVAQVEIALAAGDLDTAVRANAELDHITVIYGSSGFAASARQAGGAVLLAQGRPAEALPVLRDACRSWQALDAPYHAARVRMLLAQACAALGDADSATLELDAAATAFGSLGATADASRTDELRNRAALPDGLTAREAQVLALIAEGMTNREAAAALVVSDKTVARHLANIFTKLGLTSRTAAAAYAFQHGLRSPDRH